jgi:hypothetical protein
MSALPRCIRIDYTADAREGKQMKRSIHMAPAKLMGISVILMIIMATLPVFAQTITTPCTSDIKQFCGDVTPGGGRLVRCYQQNKDKMSAACQVYADGAIANAEYLKKACTKEIDARCNFEKGDPLEMLDCLQGNYIDLSGECRDSLNQFKGRYRKPVQ